MLVREQVVQVKQVSNPCCIQACEHRDCVAIADVSKLPGEWRKGGETAVNERVFLGKNARKSHGGTQNSAYAVSGMEGNYTMFTTRFKICESGVLALRARCETSSVERRTGDVTGIRGSVDLPRLLSFFHLRCFSVFPASCLSICSPVFLRKCG